MVLVYCQTLLSMICVRLVRGPCQKGIWLCLAVCVWLARGLVYVVLCVCIVVVRWCAFSRFRIVCVCFGYGCCAVSVYFVWLLYDLCTAAVRCLYMSYGCVWFCVWLVRGLCIFRMVCVCDSLYGLCTVR